jgi:hypothetical protein
LFVLVSSVSPLVLSPEGRFNAGVVTGQGTRDSERVKEKEAREMGKLTCTGARVWELRRLREYGWINLLSLLLHSALILWVVHRWESGVVEKYRLRRLHLKVHQRPIHDADAFILHVSAKQRRGDE